MVGQSGAVEFLRNLSEAMADGVLEAGVSDIERLDQIADDLDAVLTSAPGASIEAWNRLAGVE